MLKTERLLLRQWTQDDLLPFAEISGDKDVMEFYPSALSTEQSVALGTRIKTLIAECGWGFWAVELPEKCKFIGFVGLHIPGDEMPFSPCVEIGWRIAKAHWNNGYATEAARASLKYAFEVLKLPEVVSFTTVANTRSQAVMRKIGMTNTGQNFMHPAIDASHPQCEHVLFKITANEWQSSFKGSEKESSSVDEEL